MCLARCSRIQPLVAPPRLLLATLPPARGTGMPHPPALPSSRSACFSPHCRGVRPNAQSSPARTPPTSSPLPSSRPVGFRPPRPGFPGAVPTVTSSPASSCPASRTVTHRCWGRWTLFDSLCGGRWRRRSRRSRPGGGGCRRRARRCAGGWSTGRRWGGTRRRTSGADRARCRARPPTQAQHPLPSTSLPPLSIARLPPSPSPEAPVGGLLWHGVPHHGEHPLKAAPQHDVAPPRPPPAPHPPPPP